MSLPISDDIFVEAVSRVFDYTMKRYAEVRYIVRFAKLQREYIGFVQSCIKSGETPMTWAQFLKYKGEPVEEK